MKYKLSLLLFATFFYFKAQQTNMVINNYSIYDYQGLIFANGLSSCYPSISNTYYPQPTYNSLLVPAGTTANIGKYDSGNVILHWDTILSSANPLIIRLYNHISLSSSGPISLNSDWHHSKFAMYYSGTNTSVPYTTVNISSGTNVCYTWPSYHYNSTSGLEAEWFKIGNYSYLQIY